MKVIYSNEKILVFCGDLIRAMRNGNGDIVLYVGMLLRSTTKIRSRASRSIKEKEDLKFIGSAETARGGYVLPRQGKV